MISKAESRSIESVQRTGLCFIYGARFRSYIWALKEANMRTQAEQRLHIFEKFTRTCANSEKFSKWFCKLENNNLMATRSKKVEFKPVETRTKYSSKSAKPQMVALANRLGLNKSRSLKLKSGMLIML